MARTICIQYYLRNEKINSYFYIGMNMIESFELEKLWSQTCLEHNNSEKIYHSSVYVFSLRKINQPFFFR